MWCEDDEYDLDHVISCDLLVLPEASFDHSADIVTLLTMARKKLTSRPGPERTRQVLQLDLLLAKQHLHDQQYQAARPLLLKVIRSLPSLVFLIPLPVGRIRLSS